MGCNGGWPIIALDYIQRYGISTESEYRYTGYRRYCRKYGGSLKIFQKSFIIGCSNLQNAIHTGPVIVCVSSLKWRFYSSGVFNDCIPTYNDHAVLLVGIISGQWKIKNSWGQGWGEKGYIRLSSGNTCGICS